MSVNTVGPDVIRRLERAAVRGWPPARQAACGHWLMRRSDDASRRVNSCATTPMELPGLDLAARTEPRGLTEALLQVRQWYAKAGQAACFQMTPASEPYGLDQRLEQAGFALVETCRTMTLPLDGKGPAASEKDMALELRPTALAMAGLMPAGAGDDVRRARADLFGRVRLPRAFAVSLAGGQPVGGGYCAIDGEVALLAAIVVQPAFRRQGRAAAILARLLDWARGMGATRAMLQVGSDNATAIGLYERAGFCRAYDYWYRLAAD